LVEAVEVHAALDVFNALFFDAVEGSAVAFHQGLHVVVELEVGISLVLDVLFNDLSVECLNLLAIEIVNLLGTCLAPLLRPVGLAHALIHRWTRDEVGAVDAACRMLIELELRVDKLLELGVQPGRAQTAVRLDLVAWKLA